MNYARGSALDRIVGVARFDPGTVTGLARDPQGTSQAAIVVGLVSLALGISQVMDAWVVLALVVAGILLIAQGQTSMVPRALRDGSVHLDPRTMHRRAVDHVRGIVPAPGIVVGLTAAALGLVLVLSVPAILIPVVAWFAFSGVAWFAVNELVGHPHTRAQFAPLFRATGFSLAPIALAALAVVPVLGGVLLAVAVGWTFLLLVFSIKHTARLETGRALLAALGAAIATMLAAGLVLAILSIQG